MPLAPRTKKPLPSVAEEYLDDPPGELRVGIALSGGGIRSAAFNLGALQALGERGILQKADHLAAVSGGNYIASALALSAAHTKPEFENGKPLWGRGSPEERYLRQHTDYLAPGHVGKLWMAISVVYGFVVNYLPFALCMIIAGRLAGWTLSWLGLRLSDLHLNGLQLPESTVVRVLLGCGATFLLAAVAFVVWRRQMKDGDPGNYGDSRAERYAARLLIAAGVVVIALTLPVLGELYGNASTAALSRIFDESPETFLTTRGRVAIAFLWLVVSLLLAAAALVLSRRLRARRLMLVLSSLAGAGLLLVPLLSSLEHATREGIDSPADAFGLTVYVVIVLWMAVFMHNRRYSMHLFYRERLNSAFALKRTKDEHGRIVAEPIAYDEKLYFTDCEAAGGSRLPNLVVCCAVNLTTDDVPVGRFAESFTFETARSGGPLFGYHPTRDLEQRGGLPGTHLTLPSIMAVSGAALSPLMGRFTYPPLRFLMALTNVRLGVWIKNPNHRSRRPDSGEPEPRRHWLVRAARSIQAGWLEPGALYVLREALGGAKSSHRYIYLTDGGHWENLGVVELLRRRCTHVLCFDASCDQSGEGLDIGRAVALARSELGVDISLDPRPVLPDAEGVSSRMAVQGDVTYPPPNHLKSAQLVYAKAVLTPESTWDLHAFKARDGRFPNHSTSQQMFTDEQFEAYRTLGYEAGKQAADLLEIPAQMLRHEPAHTGNGHVSGEAVRDPL
ncbi:patatin-like phospholipase family protein [Lentzea sp. NPDC058436]|uniref:patatin-like phospholipase family protein n=1 Tax=Lentzea sp. NPDC058436 TaxID=3346499 RepID=UPI0036640778